MLARTDDAKSDERNKIKILLRSQSIYAIMLPSKASYSCIRAKKANSTAQAPIIHDIANSLSYNT